MELIKKQQAIDAVTDELDMIDHVPQWVFDRLEGRLKQLPPAQPEPCEDDPRADVYYLAEKIGINQLYELVVQLRGEPEPCEDAVSRKDCLKALSNMMDTDGFRNGWAVSRANVECMLKSMPPVTPKQPDLSEAYANAVFTWLMSYQIQSAQLKGRYTPYEVLGWIVSDWRKENGIW